MTELRAARAADLPALVALLGELFALEQDFTPDPARARAGLEALLAHPDCHLQVAAEGETVLGFCSVQLRISTASGAPAALIEDVIVQAQARGRGLGRMLLAAACDWARARGCVSAMLLVDTANAGGEAFYQATGWAPGAMRAWRRAL